MGALVLFGDELGGALGEGACFVKDDVFDLGEFV